MDCWSRCELVGVDQLSRTDAGIHQFALQVPPGVTAEMIAANPDASRPDWVKPHSFSVDLGVMLEFNPQLPAEDTAIADQARALVALHRTNDWYGRAIAAVMCIYVNDFHEALQLTAGRTAPVNCCGVCSPTHRTGGSTWAPSTSTSTSSPSSTAHSSCT